MPVELRNDQEIAVTSVNKMNMQPPLTYDPATPSSVVSTVTTPEEHQQRLPQHRPLHTLPVKHPEQTLAQLEQPLSMPSHDAYTHAEVAVALQASQQEAAKQHYIYQQLPDPLQRASILLDPKQFATQSVMAEHAAMTQSALLSPAGTPTPLDEASMISIKDEMTIAGLGMDISPDSPMRRSKSRNSEELARLSPESRDALAERMRMENRERKKRWRERNEDRNKDNDLRCRVNKRANKLFGAEASEHKTRWISEEFERRRTKRKEKETRRKQSLTGMESFGPGDSPLASGQTTPLSAGNIPYPHPYSTAGAHALQRPQMQHAHSYPTTAGDFALSEDGAAYVSAQLDRKLPPPPPPGHHFLYQPMPCECQGSTHAPDCRQQHVLRSDMVAQAHVHAHHQHAHLLPSLSASHPHMALQQAAHHPNATHGHQRGEEDFPMDAVITLMQLNNGWRTLGGVGNPGAHSAAPGVPHAHCPPVTTAAGAGGDARAVSSMMAVSMGWSHPPMHTPMTPSLSHSSTLSTISTAPSVNLPDPTI